LDFVGSALSSVGFILLSFVLSSGDMYGWNKAFIIVLLIASVGLLFAFTWVEKKVRNPIMPLSLWKVPNFAGLWITRFGMFPVLFTTDVNISDSYIWKLSNRYLLYSACGAEDQPFIRCPNSTSILTNGRYRFCLFAGYGKDNRKI
jgi:hypothetical protein